MQDEKRLPISLVERIWPVDQDRLLIIVKDPENMGALFFHWTAEHVGIDGDQLVLHEAMEQ